MAENFDIRIRTILDGAGLRATDEQVRALTADVQRLNAETSASTFGDVFGGAALGTFASNAIEGAIRGAVQMVEQYASAAVNLADRLDDLSAKAGVSAEGLQLIGNAASLSGGSIEGTANAMAFLNRTSAAARAGNEQVAAAFQRLGVTVEDLRTLSPDQLMLKFADAISTTNDRSRAYADLLVVAGRESGNLFATLEQGRGKIEEVSKGMGILGNVSVKELAAAKDAIEALNNSLTVLAGRGVAGLSVALKEAADEPERMIPILANLQNPIEAIRLAWQFGAEAGERARTAMEGMADAAAKLPPPLEEAVDAMKQMEQLAKDEAEDFAFIREQERKDADERLRAARDRVREAKEAVDEARNRLRIEEQYQQTLERETEWMTDFSPKMEKVAEDQERAADAAERQAAALTQARAALAGLEGDFGGVNEPGQKGRDARERAREDFTRRQQQAAEEALRAGLPAGDVAGQLAANEERFSRDLRGARGRFGGASRDSDRNTTGGTGPSADFQRFFGGAAAKQEQAAGAGQAAAAKLETAATAMDGSMQRILNAADSLIAKLSAHDGRIAALERNQGR